MKPDPALAVRIWLDAQFAEKLYLSSVTIAEVFFGIGALPKSRRKDKLMAALDGVLDKFADRTLPFDTKAARRYAELAVSARAAGKGFPIPDGYSQRSPLRIISRSHLETRARSEPPALPSATLRSASSDFWLLVMPIHSLIVSFWKSAPSRPRVLL